MAKNKKKKSKAAAQMKEVFRNVASMLLLFICIVGISLGVLFVKDWIQRPHDETEQLSNPDIMELTTTTTELTTETTTSTDIAFTTTTTGDLTTDTTETTTQTDATAPPAVTKQSVYVQYNSSLHAKYTSKTSKTTGTTTLTTTTPPPTTSTPPKTTTQTTDKLQALYHSFGTRLKEYLGDTEDKKPAYELRDLNGDEIPELIVSGGEEVTDSAYLFAFVDGKIKQLRRTDEAEFGSLQFVPGENLLIEVVWRGGIKYTDTYSFDGQKLNHLHSYSITSEPAYTKDGASISAEAYTAEMTHDHAPEALGRAHTLPDSADALTSIDGHPIG